MKSGECKPRLASLLTSMTGMTLGSVTNNPTEDDKMDGLERIFPEGHQYHDRIFYDAREGSYYDRGSDFYITLEQAKAFGLPV
jgi:hypothetical protein